MRHLKAYLAFLLLIFVLVACSSGGGSSEKTSNPSDVWTWITGSKLVDQAGVYNTANRALSKPGSRTAAASWADRSGNLWLFGGYGLDSDGLYGVLDDLLRFDGSTWIWVRGHDIRNRGGVYNNGSPGKNSPGSRASAAAWIDSAGNLWLFGGQGKDSVGTSGYLNDLWRFDGKYWTWMHGSDVVNIAGTYNDRVLALNVPGARFDAVSWTDASGNLWLFGGYGLDSGGTEGYLNDLWRFDGQYWTWIAGSDIADQKGIYSDANPANNVPGGRETAVSWIDKSGNLWLFGGHGWDSAMSLGYLNDLWRFDGSQWTWIAGSDVRNKYGVYNDTTPTLNAPGGRLGAVSWIDAAGKLWLFGGTGWDSAGSLGLLNDLWRFDGGHWNWISGSDVAEQSGKYGTKGVTSTTNMPGGRSAAAKWIDASGDLWLFGGYGLDSTGTAEYLNDLWRYHP